MINPLDYGGRPIHEDVSVPAATGAGSFTLLSTAGRGLYLTRLVVSTDTAQRIVVGVADEDGRRLFAGYLAANDTVAVLLDILTEGSALANGPILLITSAASGAEAQLDGWNIGRNPAPVG